MENEEIKIEKLIGLKRYKFTFNDIIDKGGFGSVYKALDLNTEVTEAELEQMIAARYEVIKYKKMQAMKEIKEIFKEHFDKYNDEIMRRNMVNE